MSRLVLCVAAVRHRSLVGGHAPPPHGASRVPTISSSMHADAITPTEPLGAVAISPKRHRPSPKLRRVGFRNMSFRGLLSVHSRFGLHVRSITQGDLCQSTSTNSSPPSSPWLLPAERPIGRVGFAPTGDHRSLRHTGYLGIQYYPWLNETVVRVGGAALVSALCRVPDYVDRVE